MGKNLKDVEVIIRERLNLKNSVYYISLIIILYISTVGGVAKKMTIVFFDRRLWFYSVLAIFIFGLVIIRSLEIFKQKGLSAVHTSDNKFLGEVGDLAIKASSILIASYTGLIVLSLIVLKKFPEEVPKEGLLFIFLLMLFLLVWSAYEISTLIRQTLIVTPPNSTVKEMTTMTDIKYIMYCSDSTAEEIQKLYKPKTKDSEWYNNNCIGENDIPECAINGHLGGTPFYTKDKKIMRSGKSTWEKLNIKPCLE